MIEYEKLNFRLDAFTARRFLKDVLAYLLLESSEIKLRDHNYLGGLKDGEKAAKIELLRKIIRNILTYSDGYNSPDITENKRLQYPEGVEDGKRVMQLQLISIIHKYAERK